MARMDVLARMRSTIDTHNLFVRSSTVIVAVSGGPDSLCLLHALLHLRSEYDLHLHVAHLDHGLRAEAAEDAAFVERTAIEWGLPCTLGRADVRTLARVERRSVEEAARIARYRFLAEVACQEHAQAVAVGHNADDQVETLLMHCLRGAGLAGLRGMSRYASWPQAATGACPPPVLVRPLLDVPRSAVEAYCTEHRLAPRYDRSNVERTYFRNRIRLDLVPYLEAYNPRIRSILHHTADLLADDYDYLQHCLEEAWPDLLLAEQPGILTLGREAFRRLPKSLQRGALRKAAHLLHPDLRDFGWVHVERARQAALHGTTGASVSLPADLQLTISYNRLILHEAHRSLPEGHIPQMQTDELPLPIPGRLQLAPNGWALETWVSREPLPAQRVGRERQLNLCLDADRAGQHLTLRTRQAGDRFQPQGLAGHSKSVKDYMIDAKIPRWARDRAPLLVSERGILWVVGWRPSEIAMSNSETHTYLCLRLVPPELGGESY